MKFTKLVFFVLFAILCYSSHAHENEFVFIGQNENDGSERTAFILELLGEDLENHVLINENGEVYLKVDKIVAIPKEAFSHFIQSRHEMSSESFGNFVGAMETPFLSLTKTCPGTLVACKNYKCERCISPLMNKCPYCTYVQY